MSYQITRTDGSPVVTISEQTADASATSLILFGRAYAKWGQALNNNLVALLENAASPLPPRFPLRGQLWFDTTFGKLKLWSGGPSFQTVATEDWSMTHNVALGFGPGQTRNPVSVGWAADGSGLLGSMAGQALGTFAFTSYVDAGDAAERAHSDAADADLRSYVDGKMYLQGNQTITLTGDASGSGTTSIAVSLTNSGVTPGNYNSLTVDQRGIVTTASNQPISITGDATGSGVSSIALTLAASGVGAGVYTKVQVDTKGRVVNGASLNSTDVTNALGFTPVTQGGSNRIVLTWDAQNNVIQSNVDTTYIGAVAVQSYVNAYAVYKGGDTMSGALNALNLSSRSTIIAEGQISSAVDSRGNGLGYHSPVTLLSEFSLTMPSASTVQKFPSGWILQTFGFELPGGTINPAKQYPVTFPHACNGVLISVASGLTGTGITVGANPNDQDNSTCTISASGENGSATVKGILWAWGT